MGQKTAASETKSPPTEVSIEEARATLGELAARVGFGRERFVITRYGEPAMALVTIADLQLIDGAV